MRLAKMLAVFTLTQVCVPSAFADNDIDRLAPWKPGYLDIHHVNTGRGDCTFIVFPDGTTLLFDAGALDEGRADDIVPLRIGPARPDSSRRPGEWIAEYIRQTRPSGSVSVDYAVVSHFHSDHFGHVNPASPWSDRGDFQLSGITEVDELVGIQTLIDRAFPGYAIPVDLRVSPSASFENYLKFIEYRQRDDTVTNESLRVGASNQITMKYSSDKYPTFEVRNIKANSELWGGRGDIKTELWPVAESVGLDGRFNENPLSIALLIAFGDFDYFTGGDMTGLKGFGLPLWFDTETPTADVVGEVDVLTLNHHGNRDATNQNFLDALRPQAIVQQTWVSDHPGGEVMHRAAYSQGQIDGVGIFATHIIPETMVAIGPWMKEAYTDVEGHVLIRVSDDGRIFEIVVLDDTQVELRPRKRFGPFSSR